MFILAFYAPALALEIYGLNRYFLGIWLDMQSKYDLWKVQTSGDVQVATSFVKRRSAKSSVEEELKPQ